MRDEVCGVISLQNLDREHAFSDSDVRLLTTLAASLSVALENARLFDETAAPAETDERAAELAIIAGLQQGLAARIDIEAMCDLVGDRVGDCSTPQSSTSRSSTATTTSSISRTPSSVALASRTARPRTRASGKHVMETRRLLVINDAPPTLGQLRRPRPEGEAPKATLWAPLIVPAQPRAWSQSRTLTASRRSASPTSRS